MLIPYNKNKNGIVIEIKQIEKQKINEEDKKFQKRIKKATETALNQIEKNEYHAELITNQVKPKNIIKLAIVFAGKEPFVKQASNKN